MGSVLFFLDGVPCWCEVCVRQNMLFFARRFPHGEWASKKQRMIFLQRDARLRFIVFRVYVVVVKTFARSVEAEVGTIV